MKLDLISEASQFDSQRYCASGDEEAKQVRIEEEAAAKVLAERLAAEKNGVGQLARG